jgi:hypothetical protein
VSAYQVQGQGQTPVLTKKKKKRKERKEKEGGQVVKDDGSLSRRT